MKETKTMMTRMIDRRSFEWKISMRVVVSHSTLLGEEIADLNRLIPLISGGSRPCYHEQSEALKIDMR